MRKDIRDTLDIFAALCAIPHPSGHEEGVAAWLLAWARAQGLTARSDRAGNVVMDCPASPGWNDRPLVILQAHTDMVCVAAPGISYDPLRDPIRVVEDGAWLRAQGTSLGGDDGIGVAMMLHILKGNDEHGPLRALFTVDEEFGMKGVKALDPTEFTDARWLINLDAERADEFTVGCAGALRLEFARPLTYEPPRGTRALKLSVLGGRGGHSGQEAHRGRVNALRAMSFLLAALAGAGVAFELADFGGGQAMNAIPGEAWALFVLREEAYLAAMKAMERAAGILTQSYAVVEPALRVETEDDNMPALVLSAADRDDLLDLLLTLPDGVSAMADGMPGLVRSSSNLSRVTLRDGEAQVMVMPRSMEWASLEHYRLADTRLAKRLGFSIKVERISPPWPASGNSRLAQTMRAVYREQNGKEPTVHACHVGLECGEFYRKAPGLEIIAVGPDIFDIHSPQEALFIDSVGTTLDLITETLRRA